MKTTIIYAVTGGKNDTIMGLLPGSYQVYKAFKDKRQAVEYARAEMLGSNRFFYVQETMLQEQTNQRKEKK